MEIIDDMMNLIELIGTASMGLALLVLFIQGIFGRLD